MKKLMILSLLSLAACATNPNKAVEVDTSLEHKVFVSNDSSLGIKNGNMVVQRKVMMSEELRTLQNEVYELEAKVYGGLRYYDNNGKWGSLRMCRTQLAALSGDGKLQWQESREYVVPESDYTSMGVDDHKNIIGLEEEGLRDRIVRFQGYRKVLQKRYAEYDDKIAACETELHYASK